MKDIRTKRMKNLFNDEAEMIAEGLVLNCESFSESLRLVDQEVDAMWADANWSEDDKSAFIAMTGIEPESVGMNVDKVAKMFLAMETIDELKKRGWLFEKL